MKREKYFSPAVLEKIVIELESEILSPSVVIDEDTEVTTAGQEVVEFDMSSFTSSWE